MGLPLLAIKDRKRIEARRVFHRFSKLVDPRLGQFDFDFGSLGDHYRNKIERLPILPRLRRDRHLPSVLGVVSARTDDDMAAGEAEHPHACRILIASNVAVPARVAEREKLRRIGNAPAIVADAQDRGAIPVEPADVDASGTCSAGVLEELVERVGDAAGKKSCRLVDDRLADTGVDRGGKCHVSLLGCRDLIAAPHHSPFAPRPGRAAERWPLGGIMPVSDVRRGAIGEPRGQGAVRSKIASPLENTSKRTRVANRFLKPTAIWSTQRCANPS